MTGGKGVTRGRGVGVGGGVRTRHGSGGGGRRGRLLMQVSVKPDGEVNTEFLFDQALSPSEKKTLEESTLIHGRELVQSSEKSGDADKTQVFESSSASDADKTLMFESSGGASDADKTLMFESSGELKGITAASFEVQTPGKKEPTIVDITVHSDLNTINKITDAFDSLRQKHATKDLKLRYNTYVVLTNAGDVSSEVSGNASHVFGKTDSSAGNITHISETSMETIKSEPDEKTVTPDENKTKTSSGDSPPTTSEGESSETVNVTADENKTKTSSSDSPPTTSEGESSETVNVTADDTKTKSSSGDSAPATNEVETKQPATDEVETKQKDADEVETKSNSGEDPNVTPDDTKTKSSSSDSAPATNEVETKQDPSEETKGDSTKQDPSEETNGDSGDSQPTTIKDDIIKDSAGDSQSNDSNNNDMSSDLFDESKGDSGFAPPTPNNDDSGDSSIAVNKKDVTVHISQGAEFSVRGGEFAPVTYGVNRFAQFNKSRKVPPPVLYDLTKDGTSAGPTLFKPDSSSSSVLFPNDNSSVSLVNISQFLHTPPSAKPIKEYIDSDFKMEVKLVEQFIDNTDPTKGDEIGKSVHQ